jgi:hypothetical protein
MDRPEFPYELQISHTGTMWGVGEWLKQKNRCGEGGTDQKFSFAGIEIDARSVKPDCFFQGGGEGGEEEKEE